LFTDPLPGEYPAFFILRTYVLHHPFFSPMLTIARMWKPLQGFGVEGFYQLNVTCF
jgi:hypothetical protein